MTRGTTPPAAALAALTALAALAAALPGGGVVPRAAAQSPQEYRHPIDLFAEMAADTVTRDLFNIRAPRPDVRLVGVDPVPDRTVALDTRALACADLDGDGWTDVVLGAGWATGDPPSTVLWGRPDGRFDPARPAALPRYLLRVVRADVDGDGRTDLIGLSAATDRRRREHDASRPTPSPTTRVVVLRNLGDRRFAVRQRLSRGVRDLLVRDLDGDGWLDLLLVVPDSFRGPHRETALLRGGADGFTPARQWPAAPRAGQHPQLLLLPLGPGRALRPAVAYFPLLGPWPPGAWLARGAAADPVAALTWQPLPLDLTGGMGDPSLADADGDGRVDVFLGCSDYAGGRNRLLLPTTAGGWQDHGRQAGLWAGYDYTHVGAWGDADNDGRLDLWQGRTHGGGLPTTSQFFWNRGDTALVNATASLAGLRPPRAMVAAWLDTDRDGRLDLITARHSPFSAVIPLQECHPVLFHNRGDVGNWLQLDLAGAAPNTDAIGAELTVWSAGRSQWRHLDDGSGSGGACPPLVQHVGLGTAAAADSVVVHWPDGTREIWDDLAAGQRHTLRQGTGRH